MKSIESEWLWFLWTLLQRTKPTFLDFQGTLPSSIRFVKKMPTRPTTHPASWGNSSRVMLSIRNQPIKRCYPSNLPLVWCCLKTIQIFPNPERSSIAFPNSANKWELLPWLLGNNTHSLTHSWPHQVPETQSTSQRNHGTITANGHFACPAKSHAEQSKPPRAARTPIPMSGPLHHHHHHHVSTY